MQDTKYNFPLLFSEQEMRDQRFEQFTRQRLGQLFLTIPFSAIASRYPPKVNHCGTQPFFSIEGGIGLMFLKSYLGLSDEKLIEQLNGNWMLQLFCQMRLGAGQLIKDSGVVSRWRIFLGQHLKEDEIQRVLVGAWSDVIEQSQTNLSDATCFESHVRFPTDTKLLWECVRWLHSQVTSLSYYLKMRQPRNKYRDVKRAYQSHSKKRRKPYKKSRALRRRLLHLVAKLFDQITPLIGLWKLRQQSSASEMTTTAPSPVAKDFFERLGLVKQVYRQQKLHFERPDVPIKNRIISLAKPYLRPIVRGKENKRVEFGKKVHKMMVDGIGWIEHWDFEAFHEGVRTKKTIWKHRSYFGKCSHFSGDALYATNKNRRYCTANGIFTSFKKKGKPSKDEQQAQQLRSLLNKERATVLEGSFGNEKNHYGLGRIRAKCEHTENAWIFFGMMCANAMKIAKRRAKKAKDPPKD